MPNTTNEQMPLIEIEPENATVLFEAATKYKAASAKRIKALEEEVIAKQALLNLIKEANLQRLENGKIKFQANGLVVTVTPRDELVRVREVTENPEGEE